MTSSLGSPIQIFFRNVRSLMLRDMRTRFGDQQLGYFWALLEPIGMIMALAIMFSTGLRGREPPIGESYILFFACGLLPYSAFRKCSQAVNRAAKGSRALLFFPILKPIDTFIAPTILESMTLAIVLHMIFFMYYIVYGSGLPDSFFMTTLPLIYISVIGFSFGVINNIIILYTPSWSKIWKIINKPMFFISGIFFTAESLPQNIQKILYYNPILHCVEWARSGYYKEWESKFVDLTFLNIVTIVLLFTALLLERAFRRQYLSA